MGVAALCSTASFANNVTQFEFDSRGRLVKVSDHTNTEVSYQLDDVGNRTSVADNTVTPSITSFSAPDVSSSGRYTTVSWTSTGTSHCTLAVFGDTSGYEHLEPSHSVSVRITENTGVSVRCYAGEQYASRGRIVKVTGGVLN